MNDALRGLSDLMGKQRQLLDRTFRAERGQGTAQGLAPEQGNLHQELGKLMEGLQQHGVQPPKGLGGAGQAMQDAQGGLSQGQLGSAEQSEQSAIEQLRDGAQSLAKQLMAQGTRARRRPDRAAVRTPFGRPTGAAGSILGGSVKVPSQSDLQRAREILEELRKRAGANPRSREELDYIERLLKQF